MKKKLVLILLLAALAAAAVLLAPIPGKTYDDGTREYRALTYRLIRWNRPDADGVYSRTRIYSLKDRDTPIDELWFREGAADVFYAYVVEWTKDAALVEPFAESDAARSCDRLSFSTARFPALSPQTDDVVRIVFDGMIAETYPGQITAEDCRIVADLREEPYAGTWLDRAAAEKAETGAFRELTVTRIFADCFFAVPLYGSPYTVKVNGALPAEYCEGDAVSVAYKNGRTDANTFRAELDLTAVEESAGIDPDLDYKPVIYLYPEAETEVSVALQTDGRLTCAYPAYDGGWRVTAAPDGTLTDARGQTYNYLYWEGETFADWDFSQGFCIRGGDVAAFLETALARLGLTRREANEFIVYWLPQMEQNPYNMIAFQTDAYTDAARLTVTPEPDTLIRVFMAWKPADSPVDLPPQTLSAPARRGFTVVEWGGSKTA